MNPSSPQDPNQVRRALRRKISSAPPVAIRHATRALARCRRCVGVSAIRDRASTNACLFLSLLSLLSEFLVAAVRRYIRRLLSLPLSLSQLEFEEHALARKALVVLEVVAEKVGGEAVAAMVGISSSFTCCTSLKNACPPQ